MREPAEHPIHHVRSADGVSIAVHQLGDREGLPVLMVHGFSSSTQRNWLDAGWHKPFLAAGLRGIAMDLRGHGASGRPQRGYGVARFIDDVDAVVEAEGLHHAGYLGYSMGSRLGWRYAARRPGVFDALVLGGLPGDDPFAGFRPELARRALATGVHDGLGPAESFVVTLATALPENDPAALVELAAEVSQTRFRPAAARPSVPVLLMSGERDDRAPDSARLAELVEDGRFVEIPARNHINAVTARQFKDVAAAWLAEQLGQT